MKCRKCNHEINVQANFCPNCGKEGNKNIPRNKILFTLFMILFIAILYYAWIKFPSILSKYEGYANEAESPTIQVAKETMKYILPVLYIDILLIVSYFLLKIKGFNRFIYPMMLTTLSSTLLYITIANHGVTAMWWGVIGFFPFIALFLVTIILGVKKDNPSVFRSVPKKEVKKNFKNIVPIIIISYLAIVILQFIFSILFPDFYFPYTIIILIMICILYFYYKRRQK